MEKIITKQLLRVFTLLTLMLTTAFVANATFYVKGSFDSWGAGVAMTDQGNNIFTAEITTTGAIDFKLVNIYSDNNGNHEDWWGYSGSYGTATSLPWNFYDLVERGGGDMHINVAGTLRFTLNTYYHSLEVVATTLAWIEGNGTVNNSYTVSDDLQVVYVSTTHDLVFARDLTGTPVTPNGIDYMTTVAKEHRGSYQYNWVKLKFNITAQAFKTLFEGKENYIIQGGTLTGVYNDNNNYTIQVTSTPNLVACGEGEEYTPNVYCPANFQVDGNGCQTGYKVEWVERKDGDGLTMHDQNGNTLYDMEVGTNPTEATYWFMTPKPMEVFELSGALYYDGTAPDNVNYPEGFYMERRWHDTANNRDKWYNPAGLKGGISYNTSCNSASPTLTSGNSYRFLAVALKPEQVSAPSYAPLREGEGEPTLDQLYYPQSGSTRSFLQAGAVNLDPTDENGQIVTAVSEVKTGGKVVSVTYCDLAGRMSQKPFAGVNIIVTRYSDGTVKTTKVIR